MSLPNVRRGVQFQTAREKSGRKQRERLRLKLFRARDNGRGFVACDVCGWRLPPSLRRADGRRCGLEAHHVIPLSEGGKDELGNLALLCPTHHRMAHDLLSELRGFDLGEGFGVEWPARVLTRMLQKLDEEAAEARAAEDAREPGTRAPLYATLPEDERRARTRLGLQAATVRLRWGAPSRLGDDPEEPPKHGPVRTMAEMSAEEIAAIAAGARR